ncbi:MAG TPA: hypothetical protein VMT28_01385 [Terriglobales bacterium]|jgi:hypothetical protein|nr:hypothetical protein [Terriglobales bacterium]
MSYTRVLLLLLTVLLTLTVASVARQPAPAFAIDNSFVQKQFGGTCTLLPGVPASRGDLNGDGIEDLVIAARCTNPLMDADEHSFTVIDPYFAFFGYGDPRLSSEFVTDDPTRRSMVLLIIHGDGPEAWRSNTPKDKFVVIDLPYKQVHVRKLALKKKIIYGIYTEEAGADQMTSVLFWDGKKYRYEPIGSSLD